MKSAEEILQHVDELNKESRYKEVEEYLLPILDEAQKEGQWTISLTVLNELAGNYRDRGLMDKALDACLKSEKLLDDNGVARTKERAAAHLNTANVYRARGDYDESFSSYKKALASIEVCQDANLYASYYNNLALLHQETGRFDDAVSCLKKAVEIVETRLNDEVRTAISKTNLATSLIRMKRLEEAYSYLKAAIDTFAGRTPSDFHYSAALSAMGDYCLYKREIEKSAEYFEAALSEIELHMGKNNFYEIVKDNLDNVYRLMGDRPTYNGLDLSEKYFERFAKPILEKNFKNLEMHIACGMFGEGSECLGFDDDSSRDHDFGPAFVLVVDDTVTKDQKDSLQKMYDNLPKSFMGISRLETAEGKGRVGVITLKDLLKKATGFDHIPKGNEEWIYTNDENLLLLTNGKVFMDKAGILKDVRAHIKNDQPYYIYFNKLAMNLELMAKHGQYGYKRAFNRKDAVAANIAKTEFIKAALKAAHLLIRKFAPYDKWLFRSMQEYVKKGLGRAKYFEESMSIIEKIAARGICQDDIEDMEKICKAYGDLLILTGLCESKEDYLLVKAYELKNLASRTVIADRIVELEFMLFDKTNNEGGRANCQDDWGTFSLMRRSQYYTWPMELLNTILVDYSESIKNGRNVVSEKYGYMMETTAPLEYEKIKDKIPVVSDDKKAVIKAISEIQVGWMEKFAKDYPSLATNARIIHTSEDTEYNTSYETYLRGELSTYHDDTLSLYGRFVAELANKNDNLAYKIMKMTIFFYGYGSLEDAVKAIK